MRLLMHDIRVVPRKKDKNKKLFHLDIFINNEHIGEYERSYEVNFARKIQEIKSSSDYLYTLYKEHGKLKVRWVETEKVVLSDHGKVGTILRELWDR